MSGTGGVGNLAGGSGRLHCPGVAQSDVVGTWLFLLNIHLYYLLIIIY